MSGWPTTVPQRVRGASHVETWLEQRPSGAMLWMRCYVCGDLTQKPCSNPQERWGHWAQVYAQMHPATPHAR